MDRLFYLLFAFDGRIGRLTYLSGLIVQIFMILATIAALMVYYHANPFGAVPDQSVAAGLGAPVSLFVLWSTLALSTKRFHDCNMSGWWYLVTFIPLVGALWWIVYMLLVPGSNGGNDYGSRPSRNDGRREEGESVPGGRLGGFSIEPAIAGNSISAARGAGPRFTNGQPGTFGRRGLS
ncbi:DUF805 domain-containing protein [Mesorhizobium sp. CAU 1741]|uniref:DUF805 domain-containing protein n=1 Tax=Mesorhizobium sp. CAU 1741 TaxID=3140366 RepID=UPI00325AE99A